MSICPDSPRQNMSMARPPQTDRSFVQIFVRSKTIVRSPCIPKVSCAFKKWVQTFMRSNLHMTRLSCIPNQNSCAQILKKLCVHPPDNCAFKNAYVETFVLSQIFVPYLCVQKCKCPDFCAFMSRPIASFIHISCTQQFYNVFISSINTFG